MWNTYHFTRFFSVVIKALTGRKSSIPDRLSGTPKFPASKPHKHGIATNAKQVLLFNPIGYPFQTLTTSILAKALELRGHQVTTLICDGIVPQCERRGINRSNVRKTCLECIGVNYSALTKLNSPYRRLSEFIPLSTKRKAEKLAQTLSIEEASTFELSGLPVGQMAYAGTLRYFFKSHLDRNNTHEAKIFREFFVSSYCIAEACPHIFSTTQPNIVFMVDGIYTYTGIYSAYAKLHNIPLKVWNRGYRKNSIAISQDGNEGECLPLLAESEWLTPGLNQKQEEELDNYLNSRKTNTNDFRVFIEDPILDTCSVRDSLEFNSRKKTIGIFTNCAWDVAVFPSDVPYTDMDRWLTETIEALANLDVQAVVRVHPYEADIWNRTQFGAVDAIKKRFPELPNNLTIIPAESKISSYALAEHLDAAIVFSSKIGLELACRGTPVLVGGPAFYRGHGFTFCPENIDSYQQAARNLAAMAKLSISEVQRARAFAYYYFFKHYTVINCLEGADMGRLEINDINQLLEGKDEGLDLACKKILRSPKKDRDI